MAALRESQDAPALLSQRFAKTSDAAAKARLATVARQFKNFVKKAAVPPVAQAGGAARHLTIADWNRLVVRRPRPYDVFALFSASSANGCDHCPSFEREFDVLADSARQDDAAIAKRLAAGETVAKRVPLAFAVVDFDSTGAGAEVFQLYGMNSAPVVMHVPSDANRRVASSVIGFVQ